MTTEQAGYLYDVFVSYRNQGDVQNWVVNRFIPELRNSLEVMMPVGWAKKHKNIFVDSESIKAGENWEVKLHSSLKQSRILIAILTTGYEDSDWC